MNLYQCERRARNEGFNTATFEAEFPTGRKTCKWLDAYFGFFEIEGQDGFVTTNQIDELFPDLVCENFNANQAERRRG